MNPTELPTAPSGVVLRLVVRNHPGVMSHVCGLFSRRSFNLDAIICVPVEDGARSEMLLLVSDLDRLEQLVLQLRKLEDVIEVNHAPVSPVDVRGMIEKGRAP